MPTPSHASIMTGTYPFQHGVRDNSGYRLASNAQTIAGLLKATGFATGAFIGAFPLDSRFGLDNGFEIYDDRFGESEGPSDFTIAERPAETVVAPAVAWIRSQQRRWFAWVHLFDPHAAYAPPPPFDRRYANSPYHGEVAYTDHALGPLLDAVPDPARPSLVIVTADHGEGLGDHGELTHGLFAYEATLRVPFIIAQLPALGSAAAEPETAGSVFSIPARHIDILPSILDVLDLPLPAHLVGRTLLPSGAESDDTGERDSYFEALSASLNRGWAPLQGVVAGRAKYIDLPVAELYDLAADPAEQTNLIRRSADRRQALEARFRAFEASSSGDRRTETADAIRRLRSLGYVSGSAPRRTSFAKEDDPKRLVHLDRAIHEGIDLYQRRRPREAIAVYRGILSERPDTELAHRHLAFLYWALGEIQPAIKTLRAAVRRGIDSRAIQTQLGIYLAESGSASETIPLLQDVATGDQPELDALNALGIAYARARDQERALETFEHILELDPENSMALENIGSVRVQVGDMAAAREAFERAVALAPGSARAHSGLGVVQLQSGDSAGAIASWRRAVELDATDYDALFNLATELVNVGELTAARPYLEQFVRTAPPAFYADDIGRLSALLEGPEGE